VHYVAPLHFILQPNGNTVSQARAPRTNRAKTMASTNGRPEKDEEFAVGIRKIGLGGRQQTAP